MRVDAELASRALAELEAMSASDRADFYRQLDRVRDSPIRRSEMHYDAMDARYVLRRFAFGTGIEKIAIFSVDSIANRIRVLRCRQARPRRLRGDGPPHA